MSLKHYVSVAALSAMSSLACATASAPTQETARTFVGSPACRDCHQAIYDRWQTTLMANVVQDPKQHPKAIVGDFSTPNPLVTFTPKDVDFTYRRPAASSSVASTWCHRRVGKSSTQATLLAGRDR